MLGGYDFSPLKGLVVDDSSMMRRLLESALQALGVNEIHMAASGAEGYDEYYLRHPDFIITDWDMEEDGGPTMVKRIRTDPKSPNAFVPIIMLTGFAEVSRVLAARDFGITEFMVKPISADALHKRLVSIIENNRPFVNSGDGYFGPCRRRLNDESYQGQNRRKVRPTEVPSTGIF